MRSRLIAFIVVALLSALASSWFHTLIGSYHLPAWLDEGDPWPHWLRNLLYSTPGQPVSPPGAPYRAGFFGWKAGCRSR